MKPKLSTVLMIFIAGVTNSLLSDVVLASPLEQTTPADKRSLTKYQQPTTIDSIETSGAITVKDWQKQIVQAQTTVITNVEIIQTEQGIELFLETDAQLSTSEVSVSENNLIADIPNAVLNLETENEFLVDNPTAGIDSVKVTNLPKDRVRITITGTNAPPQIEIDTDGNLTVVSVERGIATADNDRDNIIEIIATSEEEEEDDDDYFVPDASTATLTDTPIRDIPQSIQVIPQQVIEDQQAIRLDEVLTNVSGVISSGRTSNSTESFNIRGFSSISVLRDGFRQFGIQGQNFVETANLERVEVLKGPASILYGEIEPGGVINVVTKKPLEEGSLYKTTLQVGNDDLISPQIDFSDALTSDGSVRYRLNALYRHEDSFRNFEQDFKRFFIAPVISWQISDRTKITFQLDYTDDESPFDSGLPASGDGIFDISFDSIINQEDSIVESELINMGYDLEHRFSDNWKLRNAFRYSDRDVLNAGTIVFGFDEQTGIVTQSLAAQDVDTQNYTLQTNVVGKFDTGSVKHTLLFGIDLNRSDNLTTARLDFFDSRLFNIFDPDFSLFDDVDINQLPLVFDTDIQSNRLGIFLQNQIDILDNLILLAGVRYDTIEQTTVNGVTEFNPESSQTTENFDDVNPRVGLVYQPIPQISLFGSYSQSFTPNSATNSSGELLEPEQGEGFEFGIKAELLESRLFATLTYFNITKQNVATPDPNDFFFSVATGEQQSQGIEFDLIGEITPGWNIVANYAYIDAEVTEDNDIPVGNRLFNTPKHSASLWTTYEIQQGSLRGLGFGGGFVFVGERQGDLANSFTVDDFFVTNAAIFYKRDNWRLALNFNNLFDVDYIVATNNSRLIENDPGEPFKVRVSFSMEF